MDHCEEKTIQVPGFKIALKLWGPLHGSPVFAFHGLLDNAASYDFLAPLMPDVRLIAIDSPGCGKSSHYPPGIVPQWLEESFLMFHLANALGLQEFNVLGHSRGSIVAVLMAVAAPERVRKLGILEALGPLSNYKAETVRYLKTSLYNYLHYQEMPVTKFASMEKAAEKRMRDGRLTFESALALAKRGTVPAGEGCHWTFDRRLRSMQASFPHDDHTEALLAGIEADTCLIMASEGLKYPTDVFKRRCALIKNLTTHEVTGGHHVHMDAPGPTAAILNRFFA